MLAGTTPPVSENTLCPEAAASVPVQVAGEIVVVALALTSLLSGAFGALVG